MLNLAWWGDPAYKAASSTLAGRRAFPTQQAPEDQARKLTTVLDDVQKRMGRVWR